MPTFLTDPTSGFYLVLIGFFIISLFLVLRKRDRKNLTTLAVAILILAIVALIDSTSESPREESIRRVQSMAAAADQANRDGFVEHVADIFEYSVGKETTKKTREELKASNFWEMLKQLRVHVVVWDFTRSDTKDIDQNNVEIGFMAKGEVDGKPWPVYIRATFTKQPNGRYLLSRFATFNPINHNDPIAIPNFP